MIIYKDNSCGFNVAKEFKEEDGEFKIGRTKRTTSQVFIWDEKMCSILEYVLKRISIRITTGRSAKREANMLKFIDYLYSEYGMDISYEINTLKLISSTTEESISTYIDGFYNFKPTIVKFDEKYNVVNLFGYGVLTDKEMNPIDPEKEFDFCDNIGDISTGVRKFSTDKGIRAIRYLNRYGCILEYVADSFEYNKYITVGANEYSKVVCNRIGKINMSKKLADILNSNKCLIKCNSNILDINNITIDGNDVIYITKDKLSGRDKLKPSLYTHCKIGRFVSKFLDVDSNTLEKIQEEFDFCTCNNFNYEIISGKDITDAYMNGAKFGTIGSSCMRHESCRNFFGIYEDNAKMLIRRNEDNKIVVRAILWELTNINDGSKINMLDRIYVANHREIQKVLAYAEKMNWAHLINQTYGEIIAKYMGKSIKLENYRVDLNKSQYSFYPFLDTFRYLINDTLNVDLKAFILRSTSGKAERL